MGRTVDFFCYPRVQMASPLPIPAVWLRTVSIGGLSLAAVFLPLVSLAVVTLEVDSLAIVDMDIVPRFEAGGPEASYLAVEE